MTLPVNTDTLKKPENKTAFIEMFGRTKYNEAVDPDNQGKVFEYTEAEIEAMSDREYEKNRGKIHQALANGKVK